MGRGHSHDQPEAASERSLWWALGLTAAFLVVEVIASFISGSLALLSDAGHMATDVAALNAAGLFLVAGYVLWEAIVRFLEPAEVDSRAMLVVAFAGLVVNAIAMRLLYRGRSRSSSPARCGSTRWSRWRSPCGCCRAALH